MLHLTSTARCILKAESHPSTCGIWIADLLVNVCFREREWSVDFCNHTRVLHLHLAGVILIKKAGDGSKKIKGCWDSIHVVEVQEKSSGRSAHYKLTSTSMLWLQTNKPGSGTMNLGGSLTRQVSIDHTLAVPLLVRHMGRFRSISLDRTGLFRE